MALECNCSAVQRLVEFGLIRFVIAYLRRDWLDANADMCLELLYYKMSVTCHRQEVIDCLNRQAGSQVSFVGSVSYAAF